MHEAWLAGTQVLAPVHIVREALHDEARSAGAIGLIRHLRTRARLCEKYARSGASAGSSIAGRMLGPPVYAWTDHLLTWIR